MIRRLAALAFLALAAGLAAGAEAAPTPTSDEVLRKAGALYKSMKTCYTEASIESTVTQGANSVTRTARFTIAVRRPSTLKVSLAGGIAIVAYYDGKDLLIYNAAKNQYARREVPDVSRVRHILALVGYDIPTLELYLAPDPYAALTSDMETITDVTRAKIEGREVWRIDMVQKGGARIENYFDTTDCHLVAVKATQDLAVNGMPVTRSLSLAITRALFDETPAIEGVPDPFSFKLPEGATETPMSRGGGQVTSTSCPPAPRPRRS